MKSKYTTLNKTWDNVDKNAEKFFVSYAVRGPIVAPSYGLEWGMPVYGPIKGPVSQPSPLNNSNIKLI